MIIGTELLDRKVRAINCIEGILETTLSTIRILGRNKAAVDTTEAEVATPKQRVDKTTDPHKAAITRF